MHRRATADWLGVTNRWQRHDEAEDRGRIQDTEQHYVVRGASAAFGMAQSV